ncbi:MAX network transcriptional repressor b [Pygocentrus nattereri]|uniref:Max-binding protein MNT n=1 Tax=Pygocentrus nattereri TaxID=42514 RepID=A0A3B4E1M3_PYGNA|nr:MAX network transcriptional repressor b [Pygocentrus nattereri]
MSIDTLLEAARYLEWQAQQQQITREEEERREKALLSRGAEQKRPEVPAPPVQAVQINHVTWAEEMRPELQRHQHHPPAPAPPPPLPPPVPITVIPIPMVPANPAAPPLQATPALHTASPMPVVTPLATALSPPATPLLSPTGKDTHSPPQQPQQQHRQLLSHIKAEASSLPQSGNSPKQQPQALLQPYPAPIITTQPPAPGQHTLLPQPALAQPQSTQSQAAQPARTNGTPLEDARSLEGKRRPGGAGTREVHNKLEKNRRAHLKECFETLKRNVPNVDEKKTSNLSVLRSALRYIQTLKRKEKEYEHEMERLAREKIATQQRLAELKNELSQCMDIMEIDRILRQTVQPEDDQASTSTASEGEDNFDQEAEDDILSSPRPSAARPQPAPSESRPSLPVPAPSSILPSHISVQHKPSVPALATLSQPQTAAVTPQAIAPAPPPQPTVIAHASVSHASVIQAVNHVLPATSKHLAHIAPSGGGGQPIGHITVHPVAHLYPQSVAVSQPAVVGHITHTLAHHPQTHGQVNGTPAAAGQQGAVVGKPTAVVAHHHTGLVGQTVLNPVTMVTMPPFPVSTLKLA